MDCSNMMKPIMVGYVIDISSFLQKNMTPGNRLDKTVNIVGQAAPDNSITPFTVYHEY